MASRRGGRGQRRGQSGAGRPWAWGPTQAEQREGHRHTAKDDVFFSFAFAQGAAQRACSQQPTRNSRGWLAAAGPPESGGGLMSTRRLTPMPIRRVNQCLNAIFIFKALCNCSARGMLACGTCISMKSRPWFMLLSGVTRRCLAWDVGARGARALGSGSSWRAGEPHSAGARGAPAPPPLPFSTRTAGRRSGCTVRAGSVRRVRTRLGGRPRAAGGGSAAPPRTRRPRPRGSAGRAFFLVRATAGLARPLGRRWQAGGRARGGASAARGLCSDRRAAPVSEDAATTGRCAGRVRHLRWRCDLRDAELAPRRQVGVGSDDCGPGLRRAVGVWRAGTFIWHWTSPARLRARGGVRWC